MSLKNKNKVFILISVIILCIIIYEITKIYALFHSELDSKVEFKKGMWNIKVNNTDITRGTITEFEIDTINMDENSHVKSGKIAPGMKGNFKISINPQNTSVSVRYDIRLNKEQLTNKNIKLVSVKEKKQNNILIKTGEDTYTGIISLDDIKNNVTNEIIIEIEWIDDRQNDGEDTKIGIIENSEIKIPMTVYVSQYLGETIE